ncbi:hypothetical protein [Streptomyces sp. LN499]|uniref:hypothetical protein n=1 Tax=Streptomyces sp. LN499 TaxID=3112977 RepID=UPI00370FD925
MLPDTSGPRDRLALARLTTGIAALNTLWHLPPGEVLAEKWQPQQDDSQTAGRARLTTEQYEGMRRLAFVSIGAWTLGCETKAVKLAANLSFAAVQRHVAQFDQRAWNYNSNLNVYLLLLSLTDSRGSLAEDGDASSPEVAAAVLGAMRLYYACVYFQSGLSKLLLSGPSWADGRTLRGSWAELGTRAGKWLSRRPLSVAAVASALALGFEVAQSADAGGRDNEQCSSCGERARQEVLVGV